MASMLKAAAAAAAVATGSAGEYPARSGLSGGGARGTRGGGLEEAAGVRALKSTALCSLVSTFRQEVSYGNASG